MTRIVIHNYARKRAKTQDRKAKTSDKLSSALKGLAHDIRQQKAAGGVRRAAGSNG